MENNFDYLQYSLPHESVQSYVDTAVAALTDIKTQYPQFYKQFISPSEVLTLSGVRAFDTYYDLGKDAKPADIAVLRTILHNHNVFLFEETFEVIGEHNEDHHYSIIHIPALLDIPNRYKQATTLGWTTPIFTEYSTGVDFFLWWSIWKNEVVCLTNDDTQLAAWAHIDAWMSHNLTFGMLLGYPGEAICSNVSVNTDNGEHAKGYTGDWRKADIAHYDAFDGAQPVYEYRKEALNGNSHIQNHEKLWSAILDGVYAKLEPGIVR